MTTDSRTGSMYISVNGQHFRTKSIDRVARRLHGPNARAVIQESRNGLMHGFFVTPTRENPFVFVVKERFREEDPEVARLLRAHRKALEEAEKQQPHEQPTREMQRRIADAS